MAIVSLLDLHLLPDAPADAEQRLTAILADTRARAGLVSADVVRDITDPRHLVVLETWESLAADDAYRAWRATPEGANELAELTGGRISLTRLAPTAI
jgi:heme oxygenase (mycobilin-producing)